MKTPPILKRKENDDFLRLRLDIREELDWFRGHFEEFPVLPGIVQLHWAIEFAREHFGLTGVPQDVRRLKFKSVVLPPLVIDMEIKKVGSADVFFEFTSPGLKHSEGRLSFPGNDQ